jgi:hypothetical protein
MSQFLSAAGLFAAGTLFGICLCLAERSLRRRLKAACRPTRGRALLRWLAADAKKRARETDLSWREHNRRQNGRTSFHHSITDRTSR